MSKRTKLKRYAKGDQMEVAKWQEDVKFPNDSSKKITETKYPSIPAFRRFQKNQQKHPDAMQIQQKKIDPDAMRIQQKKIDPDAMQIQSIPRYITRIPSIDTKTIMIHILEYFKSTNGHINRLLKYVLGDDSMGMNKCSKDTMEFAENCSLASQCYSTTQLVNYFFGNPVESPHVDIIYKTRAQTTDAQEILNFISKDLHEGEVMNMNISVCSTREGFPGHIFNILFLKQNGKLLVFVVQSFIYSYTFFYNVVPVGSKNKKSQNMEISCYDILQFYIDMFHKKRDVPFSKTENKLWKYLTNNYLEDYSGNSLIGTSKPTRFYMIMKKSKFSNLFRHVKQKYRQLLEDAFIKLEELQKDIRQNRRNSIARVHSKTLSNRLEKERSDYKSCFGSIVKLPYWKQKIKETIEIQSRL